MVADDKIIHFGPQANQYTHLSEAAQHAIKASRELLLNGLPKSFAFFDSLDDTLFDLADKAESNQKQEEYFTAMRQIRLVQSEIKKQFTQNIITDFDAFWKKPTTKEYPHLKTSNKTAQEDTELSLLHNADLEEDIAIKRISSRSQSVCGNEIGKLTARYAYMLHIENKAEINNPLDTDNVIEQLKKVISPLAVSLPVKLVIYKQYEKQAVNSLFTLYQSLNKLLIEQGILPKIPFKSPASTQHSPSQANNTNSSPAFSSNLPLNEAVEQHMQYQAGQAESDLFNNLRHILAQSHYGSSSTRQQYASSNATEDQLTSIADPATVMSALSHLQHQQPQPNISDQGHIVMPPIRNGLMQNLNASNSNGINQTISPLDNDTLDIMDMLFEFILEDKHIPIAMRALLARLQIPMLKIAISDKGFFQHKHHPARRLLNNLAQAATGWTQSKQYEQDALYRHIEGIVDQLIDDFDTDIRIFDHINEQLTAFIAQYQQSSEAVEKLTAETSQGQERVQLAQQQVDQAIHDLYVEFSPIPKVIISLIEDGWKQSLRLRLIQKGQDSEEWQTSINLIRQLLKSVKPTDNEAERQQRLEMVPGLHKEVQQYLQTTPITANTLTVLLKSLQRCHIKILNGDEILENELQHFEAGSSPKAKEEITDPEKRIEIQMYSNAEAIEKVKRLKPGTWVDIKEADQAPRRIKFSWRSNLTKRCLFVTSKGVKAAEWSEQELAAMFEKGEASILDQSKPLMDRALMSMMETINKSR